jgi:hypothetical protein
MHTIKKTVRFEDDICTEQSLDFPCILPVRSSSGTGSDTDSLISDTCSESSMNRELPALPTPPRGSSLTHILQNPANLCPPPRMSSLR